MAGSCGFCGFGILDECNEKIPRGLLRGFVFYVSKYLRQHTMIQRGAGNFLSRNAMVASPTILSVLFQTIGTCILVVLVMPRSYLTPVHCLEDDVLDVKCTYLL